MRVIDPRKLLPAISPEGSTAEEVAAAYNAAAGEEQPLRMIVAGLHTLRHDGGVVMRVDRRRNVARWWVA